MSTNEGADEAIDAVADHMPTGILDDSNVRDALRSLFVIAVYPPGLPPSVLLIALLNRESEALSGPLSGRGVERGAVPDAAAVSMVGVGWPLAAEGIGGSVMSPEEAGRNG